MDWSSIFVVIAMLQQEIWKHESGMRYYLPEPKATVEEIRTLEKNRLGGKELPAAYKSFFESANGYKSAIYGLDIFSTNELADDKKYDEYVQWLKQVLSTTENKNTYIQNYIIAGIDFHSIEYVLVSVSDNDFGSVLRGDRYGISSKKNADFYKYFEEVVEYNKAMLVAVGGTLPHQPATP